jgi:transcriptional regulator with PAS, ATPase and Fis domain
LPLGQRVEVGDSAFRVVAQGEEELALHEHARLHGLIGASVPMRELAASLLQAAQSDSTVLLLGETGTGKEVAAEALHLSSPRAAGPMVIVDCGALQPNLIESELFGHERGAFTGASERFEGAFDRASGGTLFLDEIGELPLSVQPKLLRVLDSRTVRRVGGSKDLPTDVRVVAATHRDLAVHASKGLFRKDLYYRLAVISLHLPPLRDRIDDIPLIAISLLEREGIAPETYLTAESLAALKRHDWPGNVRELKNTLMRAIAMMRPIEADDFLAKAALPPQVPIDLSVPMRDGIKQISDAYRSAYIEALLSECKGNVSEVARRAGVDRLSIYRIIERLKLTRP